VDWDKALARAREVAEFCAEAGLERYRVSQEDLEIEVRRSSRRVADEAAAPAAARAEPGSGLATSNGSVTHEGPVETLLKAEFVGIVRFTHPAVVEGAHLPEGRELAYVESLGIRNPIRVVAPSRVTAVLVTDGQPVEYAQPLFAVEPAP
jgi:acetyl-CoA carboxylase biotin carboxyl carrier protein